MDPGCTTTVRCVCIWVWLTIVSWVQEVFPQVASEHPLPEDAPLLQLLLGGPGLHEGAQEGDQLPVLLRHWEAKDGRTHLRFLTHMFSTLQWVWVWHWLSFHTSSVHALEWNPIQGAQRCPIVYFSFILMQTRLLCMSSFLEAKASFLNTTSQATTMESSTSNTSILSSSSARDKKKEQTYLENPTRINQILFLGKGRKLLKLYTSYFLCLREMWKGYQVNQTICREEQWSWPPIQTFVQKTLSENPPLADTGQMTGAVRVIFHSGVI